MIPDLINSAWAAVLEKIGGAWATLWSPISDAWPLWWSYGVFGLILIAAIVMGILIRLFLPSDWTKYPLISIFVGILAAGAWLFGSVSMYNKMKAKLDAAKNKNRPPVKPKIKPPDDSWKPFG